MSTPPKGNSLPTMKSLSFLRGGREKGRTNEVHCLRPPIKRGGEEAPRALLYERGKAFPPYLQGGKGGGKKEKREIFVRAPEGGFLKYHPLRERKKGERRPRGKTSTRSHTEESRIKLSLCREFFRMEGLVVIRRERVRPDTSRQHRHRFRLSESGRARRERTCS